MFLGGLVQRLISLSHPIDGVLHLISSSGSWKTKFGRFVEEGYEFIDDRATHHAAAGGRDGGSIALEGVFMERLLLLVISLATQVAILRRKVQRYAQAGTTRAIIQE